MPIDASRSGGLAYYDFPSVCFRGGYRRNTKEVLAQNAPKPQIDPEIARGEEVLQE